MAMLHLYWVWMLTSSQSAEQLGSEAQLYHSLSGAATYDEIITSLAVLQDQAKAEVASVLTIPHGVILTIDQS